MLEGHIRKSDFAGFPSRPARSYFLKIDYWAIRANPNALQTAHGDINAQFPYVAWVATMMVP